MRLDEFKQVFDGKLKAFIERKIEKLHSLYREKNFDMLFDYLHTYIQEGKRFRPYLVYTLYKAYGGKDDEHILDLSLSFELLHLFALVHDDICDKGMRRHSADTYHIHLGKVLTNEHHGSSQALLLGDMLFSWAQEHFHQLNTSAVAKEQFTTEIEEVIYGQMMDVYFSNVEVMYYPMYISLKDRLKSGRYSFMRPMCVGAACAGQENVSEIEIL